MLWLTILLAASLVFLLACSCFFSSTETAFFSLNPLQVRRLTTGHPAGGVRIHELLGKPTALLSTILIGNTIVNILAANAGYELAELYFPNWGEAISISVMTLLLLFFGEVGPKRFGLAYAEVLALRFLPLLQGVMWLLTPLRVALECVTRRLEPLLRPHGRTLNEEEFETVLDMSGEAGVLNADELAMIKAIIHLEDLKASDVMTPRVDLVGLDVTRDPAGAVARAREARRHFLLLYREQFDNVEGFLDVRRFLLDPEHRLEAARLPPFYVPESSPVSQVLSLFQKEKRRIAVVVDEYGGTAGVMTRGDVLEEISGVIYNELSKPRPIFQSAGPHSWLVDANISLEEINRKLLLHLHADGVDRLSGWIAAHAGHLPQEGDVVTAQGCQVTVRQTIKLRATVVEIKKLESAP